MKQKIKEKWLLALGEEPLQAKVPGHHFPQAADGILCNVYAKEHKVKWQGNSFMGRNNIMPDEVKKWAGLERLDPYLPSLTPPPFHGKATLTGNDATWGELIEAIKTDL